MRIGLVCPYAWGIPGGVQNHIAGLAGELTAGGHEVEILTPTLDRRQDLPAGVTSGGVGVPVRYNGSTARIAFGPSAYRSVKSWLAAGDFDLVHVHEPTVPSLPLMACKLAEVPVVSTWHIFNHRSRAFELTASRLERVWANVSHGIVVSPAALELIADHVHGTPIEVIPNGIHLSQFAGGSVRTARRAPHLLFLGRFEEARKGVQVLLDALPDLVRALPGCVVTIAGPGDVRRLADRVPVQARANVRLVGEVSDAERTRLYREADVFVAPNTRGESFGLVLVEAMASGTAVVASDIHAFSHVLESGRSGSLFTAGDPAQLVETCRALWSDSRRREAQVAAALRAASKFDWSTVADQVLSVYDKARGLAEVNLKPPRAA